MNQEKKWQKSSDELKNLFIDTMMHFPEVEKRQMFGYPCCFYNGNMFTGLHEDNWILRLNEPDRMHFMATYDTQQFEPFAGRIMKEYCIIPKQWRTNPDFVMTWMEKSLNYVKTMPKKEKKKTSKKAL